MSTTDLVLYVPELLFNRRPGPFPPIYYRAPSDTRDPRWAACRDHHVACDCREAEHAEEVAEWRGEAALARRMEDAIDAVLMLHVRSSSVWSQSCTGCINAYPCPTRNLLAPLSWRAVHEGMLS